MELNMTDILGADIETCVEEFKKMTKGELVNLTKLLTLQYEQVNNIKNSLLVMIECHETGKEKLSEKNHEEVIKSVDDLYLSLQLIEDRYMIANELLEDLNKQEKLRVEQAKKDIN